MDWHLDRARGSPPRRAPECEWRDPEDVYATTLIQGVLPRLDIRSRIPVPSSSPDRESSKPRPTGLWPNTKNQVLSTLKRTPRISIVGEASSGSLHSSSVTAFLSESVEMTAGYFGASQSPITVPVTCRF